ncbi:MBL fold metallo-hydrolase [Clostridium sp. LBM24168]
MEKIIKITEKILVKSKNNSIGVIELLSFLGRGSAFNIKEGNNSAYLKLSIKYKEDTLFLMDCGENIFERIVRNRLLDDKEETGILITHLHSDHVGSLSSLIYYCYYIKHIVPNVYFPNKDLYVFLKNQGNTDKKDYNFHLLDIDTDNFVGIGDIKIVKPIEVKHVKEISCFGYLINIRGKLIWYSGDCSSIPSAIDYSNIYIFYQDTCLADYDGNVHMSLESLCKSVPEKIRSKIYCMHIDCRELIEKAEKEKFNVVSIENNIFI